MKKRSLAAAVSTALLATTMLAGCGQSSDNDNSKTTNDAANASNAAANNGKSTAPDLSEHVDLVWYLVGPPAADTEQVVSEWNKMLEKDLNTTVKLNFTDWTDWQTKYNLLLTSGEKIDMIFASTWADFYKYAKQGAFMDLTEMIPKDMPISWSKVSKQDWEDASLDGKILAVPGNFTEYNVNGFVYREDWRKKYNLPEIKDMDTLEAYMAGIKQNLPEVTPLNGASYNGINRLFYDSNDFQAIGGVDTAIVSKSYDAPRDVIAYAFTPEFADYAKRMKKWADAGYWTKDVLSSKVDEGVSVQTGVGALSWRNPNQAGELINDTKVKNPEIEIGYFPFPLIHGRVQPNLSINNGMAVPKSAAHPDRALMVLDKLRNDPKYYDLMTYGVEGKNYSVAEDGKHVYLPAKGQDPKKVSAYGIASWGWRIDENVKPVQGGWDGWDKLMEQFKSMSVPNIFQPIFMDYEPVKSELAAVNQVRSQYEPPIIMGVVPDVDAAIKEYQSKLKAAGVDKLLAYVKEQVDAYMTAHGK